MAAPDMRSFLGLTPVPSATIVLSDSDDDSVEILSPSQFIAAADPRAAKVAAAVDAALNATSDDDNDDDAVEPQQDHDAPSKREPVHAAPDHEDDIAEMADHVTAPRRPHCARKSTPRQPTAPRGRGAAASPGAAPWNGGLARRTSGGAEGSAKRRCVCADEGDEAGAGDDDGQDGSDDDVGECGRDGDDTDDRSRVQQQDKYAAELWELAHALDGSFAKRDFCVSDVVHEFAPPGLVVDGVGAVLLPDREKVQQVIAKCKQASWGCAGSVGTWQLHCDAFSLTNPAWRQTLDPIVERCRRALGVLRKADVDAKLIKLMIDEKGGAFEAHCDGDTESGLVGTLLIMLPSAFEGGSLVVRHAGEERRFDPSGMNAMSLKFVAFHADSQCEALPVTQGSSMFLVYNLVVANGLMPQLGGNASKVELMLEAITQYFNAINGGQSIVFRPRKRLRQSQRSTWEESDNDESDGNDADATASGNRPEHLAYILKHKYTRNNLRVDFLHGKDCAIAQALTQACKASKGAYGLYLCQVRYRSKYWKGSEHAMSEWLRPFDHCVPVVTEHQNPMKLKAKFDVASQLLPVGAFERVKFDKTEHEPSGTDRTLVHNWHNAAALVIVSKTQEIRNRVSALGLSVCLPVFLDLVAEKSPDAVLYGDAIVQACGDGKSPGFQWNKVEVDQLCEFVKGVGLLNNLEVFRSTFEFMGIHDTMVDHALLELINVYGWENSVSQVVATLKSRLSFLDRLAFLRAVAATIEDQAALKHDGVMLVDALLDEDVPPGYTSVGEYDLTSPFEMQALFGCVHQLAPTKLMRCLDVEASLERVIAPGLRNFIRVSGVTAGECIQAVLDELEAIESEPVTRSIDPSAIWCRCCDCHDVRDFLSSSDRTYSLRAVQKRRTHVERAITVYYSKQVSMETHRVGHPHTLVLTKRDGPYEERRRAAEEAQDLVQDLLQLLG